VTAAVVNSAYTGGLTGAGTGAPNNRLVNSTLAGYSPPSWPPASTPSVDIDCYPSSGLFGYLECSAYAWGGTGSGYEYTWVNATGFGEYAYVQCPWGNWWVDVYATVLDSGGSGTTRWESFQCGSGWG
jgi:hypothetical protein